MRVTKPIAAAPRLLIAIDGHAAKRDFDIDCGLEECKGKRDVQRLFRERGRLYDPVLDVHPGQLVVQRDCRRDRGEPFECSLDHEAHPDTREPLAARAHELGLRELELRRGFEPIAVACGPEPTLLTPAP